MILTINYKNYSNLIQTHSLAQARPAGPISITITMTIPIPISITITITMTISISITIPISITITMTISISISVSITIRSTGTASRAPGLEAGNRASRASCFLVYSARGFLAV